MATFSINLSDQLAKASGAAAKRLDLTRAEFIRLYPRLTQLTPTELTSILHRLKVALDC